MRTTLPVSVLCLTSLASAQWTQVFPASSPTPRIEPQMAFGGAGTILFGGANVANFPPTNYADTWSFDGDTWTQLSPAVSPPARYYGGAAYDPVRGRVVVYGGLVATFFGANYLDDTWEFDGATWMQVATVNSPGGYFGNPGVGEVSMAYDLIGQRIVMFGGELFQGIVPAPNLTFEYDGTNWTQTAPATAPSGRSQVSLCSAPTLGGVLLFGGTNFNNPPGPNGEKIWDDTWVYSALNDTWTQLAPVGPLPTARAGASLLFDANAGVYVLHGGYGYDPQGMILPLADTWTFDGTSWTDVTSTYGGPAGPLLRFASAEGPNGCHVLFGGAPAVFGTPNNDTWIQGCTAAATVFGSGCAGSAGTPALAPTNVPSFGSTFTMQATNLAPAAALAFLSIGFSDALSPYGALPLNLQPLGLGAGCSLLVSGDATVLFAVSGGAGSFNFNVPSGAAWAGFELHFQVASIDAGATGGLAVSNAVTATFGF